MLLLFYQHVSGSGGTGGKKVPSHLENSWLSAIGLTANALNYVLQQFLVTDITFYSFCIRNSTPRKVHKSIFWRHGGGQHFVHSIMAALLVAVSIIVTAPVTIVLSTRKEFDSLQCFVRQLCRWLTLPLEALISNCLNLSNSTLGKVMAGCLPAL